MLHKDSNRKMSLPFLVVYFVFLSFSVSTVMVASIGFFFCCSLSNFSSFLSSLLHRGGPFGMPRQIPSTREMGEHVDVMVERLDEKERKENEH